MKETYTIQHYLDMGFEAKWAHDEKKQPVILVRDPKAKHPHQRNTWWRLSPALIKASSSEEEFRTQLDAETLIGDVFSLPT